MTWQWRRPSYSGFPRRISYPVMKIYKSDNQDALEGSNLGVKQQQFSMVSQLDLQAPTKHHTRKQTIMNLSLDTSPAPLEPQSSLSYEDFAPLLRFTSSFGKIVFEHDDEPLTMDGSVPDKLDVLCGRDKESYSHVGNKQFRVIVATNRERYQSCTSRDEKTKITTEIIKGIRDCGGRFLRKNEKTNLYEDVGDEYAHEKVSHALRSAKDPKKKQPRKKRKVVRKPPTPQENKTFEFLFTEQQRIFQDMLVQQRASDAVHESSFEWQSSEVVVGV